MYLTKNYKVVTKVKHNSIVDLMMQCTEIESAKSSNKAKKDKKAPVEKTPVVETPVIEPVKRKRRTKAEMEMAKKSQEVSEVVEVIIEPTEQGIEVPAVEVEPKRKRRTKAEMALANAPVVQPVAVVNPIMSDEQKKEIVKYVIGYADAYRISQFKNMETHTQLTKEQFIESAKQIYRETPDVKYVYVECFYLDNECRTEVIFKDPRKELFTLNRLWSE